MNYKFDIIIIGDSLAGYKCLKKLAENNSKIKIAYISRDFKERATKNFINVTYIKNEVLLVDYKNRLFGCYLDNNSRCFSTHLIIASGLAYEPFKVSGKIVPNVHNTVDEVPKYSKLLPAVVLCETETDIKFAINIAKKYKCVYACLKDFSIKTTPMVQRQLAMLDNLLIMPNSTIIRFFTKDGKLSKVELSTFSQVICSDIYVKTKALPETYFIPNNIFNKDKNNLLIVDESLQSTLVPKSFAIGNCAIRYNVKALQNMINKILQDFT